MVASLIQQRRFADALVRLELEDAGGGDAFLRQTRMRHCLARLGRLREAAEVGRRVVALSECGPMDCLRLARILLDLHDVEAAAPIAVRAVAEAPAAQRGIMLGPMVECLLRDPGVWAAMTGERTSLGLDLADDRAIRQDLVRRPTLHVPLLLPPYQGTDFDHPAHMRLIERLSSVAVDCPTPADWIGVAGFGTALKVARRAVERFAGGHGALARARAARFVADRFSALLHPPPRGALQFVMGVPLTVGDGPWVYWFDQLISAFQPTQMFERTIVSAFQTPDWHFLRTLLDDRRCRLVFSHFRETPENLGRFFRSPGVVAKTRHIHPYEAPSSVVPADARAFDGPLGVLFTSSRTPRPETFFYRGGVDALAIFRRYRDKGGKGCLTLRCPLPAQLNGDWLAGILADGGITVLDGILSDADFMALRASCHINLLPAVQVYRASLVESMAVGLVPLAYHTPGISEFIDNGRTGILTHRTPPIHALDAVGGRFSFDAPPLFAAAGPPLDQHACDRLADALLALDRDRPRLAGMARAARASASGMIHSPKDQVFFDAAIAEQAEAALRAERL